MKTLTLGKIISKVGAVCGKDLSLVFDDGRFCPDGLDSWRGNYAALAIGRRNGIPT